MKWNLKVWTILSFQGNDSLVVVCLPELFENIPPACFCFVFLWLLATHDWHWIPYYGKLTLVLNNIFEINTTSINVIWREFCFPIKEIIAKQGVEISKSGKLTHLPHKNNLLRTRRKCNWSTVNDLLMWKIDVK